MVALGTRDGMPVEIDLADAGGLRLIGRGADRAERAVLLQILGGVAQGRLRAVTTRADLCRLLGEEVGCRVADARVPGLGVAAMAADALDLMGGEIVGRTALMEDGEPGAAGSEAAIPLACVLTPDQQASRANAELRRGAGLGIGGLILGDWSYGTTLAVDSGGVVVDATGKAADGLSGAQITLLGEADALEKLSAIGIGSHTSPAGSRLPATAALSTVGAIDVQEPPGLIRLIGQYAIQGPNGDAFAVQSQDIRGLLALLAHHRTTLLTDETIVEKLWDGLLPTSGRLKDVLKSTRGKMCEALGLPSSQGTSMIANPARNGYRIDSRSYFLDVWRLHDLLSEAATAHGAEKAAALTAAVDLYTGPYLPGLPFVWAHNQARDLVRDVVQAFSQLADLADGPEGAVSYLERAADLDPSSEHLCRQQMMTYANLREITAVHNCYERLRELLQERRRKPEPRTVDLYRRLTSTN